MYKLGDIVKGNEIGKKTNDLFVMSTCSGCGVERWVRKSRIDLPHYTGLCRVCSGRRSPYFKHNRGEAHHNWNGGRTTFMGYVMVKLQTDDFFFPMAHCTGYVREHRLVMARHLGRCLESWEIVHHKNGVRDDNRLENLELGKHVSQHMKEHSLGYRDGFDKGYRDGDEKRVREIRKDFIEWGNEECFEHPYSSRAKGEAYNRKRHRCPECFESLKQLMEG